MGDFTDPGLADSLGDFGAAADIAAYDPASAGVDPGLLGISGPYAIPGWATMQQPNYAAIAPPGPNDFAQYPSAPGQWGNVLPPDPSTGQTGPSAAQSATQGMLPPWMKLGPTGQAANTAAAAQAPAPGYGAPGQQSGAAIGSAIKPEASC